MTAETLPSHRAGRLASIDALRGAAVLLVLFFHAVGSCIRAHRTDCPVAFALFYPVVIGYIGVHLFLVISGFCIHQKLASTHRSGPMKLPFRKFWARRFVRLYPPYLVVLFICSLLMIATQMRAANEHSWATLHQIWTGMRWDLFAHLFMLQIFVPAFVAGMMDPPLWSLALEEHLYLLYSPVLWLRNRLGVGKMLIMVGAICLGWRAVSIWVLGSQLAIFAIGKHSVNVLWMCQAPARWLEWCLGAVAVEALYGRVNLPRWCRSWKACAGLCLLANVTAFTPLGWLITDPAWGACFFVLINIVTHREVARRSASISAPGPVWVRIFAWFGTFSYSLYLVHYPILRVAQIVAYNRGYAADSSGLFVAGMLAVFVAIPTAYLFPSPLRTSIYERRWAVLPSNSSRE